MINTYNILTIRLGIAHDYQGLIKYKHVGLLRVN